MRFTKTGTKSLIGWLEVYEEILLEIGFMRPNIIIKSYDVMCQLNGIYDYVRYVHDKSPRERVRNEGQHHFEGVGIQLETQGLATKGINSSTFHC